MQVVIGGAYNGKRKYVQQMLQPVPNENIYFYDGTIPNNRTFSKANYVVIDNFETIINSKLDCYTEDEIVEKVMKEISILKINTNVICICTDIGRGIVPMEKNDRKLRDTCGRLYQRLFMASNRVIRIWYGIPQIVKGMDDTIGQK